MKRLTFGFILLCLLFLAFAARCWPLREVFVNWRIYFADPDCYSRMTRARMVSEGKAIIIKHHDFENHPVGTTPHTTAPLDFAIAGLARAVDAGFGWADGGRQSVLRPQTLDLAGALIGPLFGIVACVAVAFALPRNEPGERWRILASVLLIATSPILVQGTLLGRPDHQALLIPLVAVALALELRLLRAVSQKLAATAGTAWGLALWVSLYEPLILLALTWIGLAIFQRSAFRERERFFGWLTTAGIFAAAALIDGWRLETLDASMRATFARWSADIAELKHVPLFNDVLWSWIGFAAILAPVALGWLSRVRLDARIALWLLLSVFALTLWQARWGYFFVLVLALTLPLQMLALRRQWMAWTLFVIGLWPVLEWWDSQLYPQEPEMRRRVDKVEEQVALRAIAEQQGARKAGAFVAPWWLSPAIAYWSGQPGVAGSSHQSLPGIADTARIYLAPDAKSAAPILHRRDVRWILSEIPERIVPNSAQVLGVPEPAYCLAYLLDSRIDPPPDSPIQPERAVKLFPGRDFFHVWRVEP